jgi:hypothetical protein
VKASGGRWLAQGDVQVVEGAWPDSVVLILVDHVAPGFTVAGFAQQVRAAIAAGTGAGS